MRPRIEEFVRPLPRHRGQRGFALSEMIIATFLAAIVSVAAFHINATFQSALNRQQNITRIQQTLKVTRQLLERRIRPAGAGYTGIVDNACGNTTQVGPFVLHNKNTFGVSDTTAGGNDDDPDWIEIMAADLDSNGYLDGGTVTSNINATVRPQDTSNFAVGDMIGIQGPGGICLFIVTAIQGDRLMFNSGQSPDPCFNGANWRIQQCRNDILQTGFLDAGSPIINFSSGTFALRIDDTNPNNPVLMMARGRTGSSNPAGYAWQPLADNVEDMQVAVHLDNSVPPDRMGDYWVNDRDLLAAELNKVRAVRISIVFRTTNEMVGWAAGRRPQLEDRPAGSCKPVAGTSTCTVGGPGSNDGYLRRVMTTVIKLRNMPEAE